MADRVTTKDTLLEAADALIEEGGNEALTMRALASACNISPSTVYNYFRHRDHLVESLCARYLARLGMAEPSQTIVARWAQFIWWARNNPHRSSLVLSTIRNSDDATRLNLFTMVFPTVDPVSDPNRVMFITMMSQLIIPSIGPLHDAAQTEAVLEEWLRRIDRWTRQLAEPAA